MMRRTDGGDREDTEGHMIHIYGQGLRNKSLWSYEMKIAMGIEKRKSNDMRDAMSNPK